MDSLGASVAATQRTVAAVRGAQGEDLYRIQQQLVQVQELTGQSQQPERAAYPAGKSESGGFRGHRWCGRSSQSLRAVRRPDVRGLAPAASPGQRRHGADGLPAVLKNYPTSPKVPDAIYFIGKSWATEAPIPLPAITSRWSPATPPRLGRPGRCTSSDCWPNAAAISPRPGRTSAGSPAIIPVRKKRPWFPTS